MKDGITKTHYGASRRKNLVEISSLELKKKLELARQAIDLMVTLPDDISVYIITCLSKYIESDQHKCLHELLHLVGPREDLIESFRKALKTRLVQEDLTSLLHEIMRGKGDSERMRVLLYASQVNNQLFGLVQTLTALEYCGNIDPVQLEVLRYVTQNNEECNEHYLEWMECLRNCSNLPPVSFSCQLNSDRG